MVIRILLAEDQQMFRQVLGQALASEDDIKLIGEAGNGRDAIEMVTELSPDVLVIDIGLPRMNGIDAANRVRTDAPETKVVILSRYTDEQHVAQALRAGARGFVLKSAAMEELLSAIRAVNQEQFYLSPAILQPIVAGYMEWTTGAGLCPHERLTSREREIMQLVAEGKTSQQVAEELRLNVRTVESHRSRLMNKLDFRNVADLVRYSIQHGLVDIVS